MLGIFVTFQTTQDNPFELTHEPESLQHTDIEGISVSVPQVGRHGRVGFSELLNRKGCGQR